MIQTPSEMTTGQGPEWLADLYFSPPPWVNPLLKIIAAVALIIVAYRLYQRDWHLDMDTQREMQIIVASVVGIMTATLAMVNLADQPYIVDVAVGLVAGYGPVLAVQHPRVGKWWSDTIPDPRTRRAAVWIVLGIAAFVGPPVVAVERRGLMLSSSRMYLYVISAGIAFYDVMLSTQRTSQRDTGSSLEV